MASNTSMVFDLPPLPAYTLTPREPLIPWLPDNLLALMLPIIAYWVVSLAFHYIDVNDYFPQYRLHTPAELLKRNHVSRWDVVRDVIVQQIIQTFIGFLVVYFDGPEYVGKEEYDVATWARRIRIVQRAIPPLFGLVGIDSMRLAEGLSRHPIFAAVLAGGKYPDLVQNMILEDGREVMVHAFARWELITASILYWYLVPATQFIGAIVFVDTWQYFLHRAMHMNRWLYVTFHSRHHRLYVPYAFGALYNHPFEGFLLDTAGAGLAFLVTRMSTRQSMWFFTFSTIKTVDDHCGYAFPWDPLQHITGNNSAYHDIHHQSWGIKTNYSQPFFIFWDRLLGTQWKGDASLRYQKSWVTAQKKVEMDSAKASNPQADTTPVPFSKEDEEGPVARKIGNQGMHTKAPSRSVQKEGLVGHLVTGSIRQK